MLRIAVAHQRDAILITEGRPVAPGGRRIVYVNPAFTAMTGWEPYQVIGRTPQVTIGPDSDRGAIAAIQEAINGGRPVRQEILKYRKDGSTFWAEVDIAPASSKTAEPLFLVCVMRDVTERRKQADLLRMQSEELVKALSARSAFLANVSHELRTPLSAILGYTNILERGAYGELAPDQRRSLGRVSANAKQLLSLITNLLDLSWIDSGRMPIQTQPFDLQELVAQVVVDLDPLVRHSGLHLSTRLAPGKLVVVSDRQKVQQILVNLVSNALKFTTKGWVRIELRATQTSASITVADSGVGISSSAQEHIFDDFWQASPGSLGSGGAGLGLAISQRLASALGGSISVRSTLGKGSRFTLRIPRGHVKGPKRALPSGTRSKLDGASSL